MYPMAQAFPEPVRYTHSPSLFFAMGYCFTIIRRQTRSKASWLSFGGVLVSSLYLLMLFCGYVWGNSGSAR